MRPFDYYQPSSLEEAWRLGAALPEAPFIAGGTDLLVRLRDGALRPPALISLSRLGELRVLELGPPVRIGALVSVAELTEHAGLGVACPVLVQAARRLGSIQIRNRATVGGNLCNASPCADLAPPLLVLGARLRLAGPQGEREVATSDFFVGPGQTCLRPGEILTEVCIDPPPAAARGVFLKKGRVRMDLALASVAVLLDLGSRGCSWVRLAAGAVAPRPVRLRGAEAALAGRALDGAAIAAALAAAEREIEPITDVRASAAYRRHLTGALVARALGALGAAPAAAPGEGRAAS
ncbi:MAG: xanthine dehydrogenase family protein subunit M [Deltaproteobacteria bacterium]|nr:xanthine dehydrogenase family protein subunit M [Deltaproteobacteria bacterium]